MREILFRGKYEPFNKWYYGNYECSYGKHYIIHKEEVQATLDDDIHIVEIKDLIIPESVGQFTELYDKNNVRIFEGDIVKYKLDEDYPEYIGIIKFGNTTIRDYKVYNGWYVELKNPSYYKKIELTCSEYFEVIGNIYDNPELIK